MRVIGGPQQFARPQLAGAVLDGLLHRLKGNPALALEVFAGSHFQRCVVHGLEVPLAVEMPVHAVEPGNHPSAAAFEESEMHAWKALAHSTPDDVEAGEHH